METSYENPAFAASCMDYVNSVRSIENWQFDLKYLSMLDAFLKAHAFYAAAEKFFQPSILNAAQKLGTNS